MIVTPEVVPFLWAVTIGAVIVIAIVASGVAVIIVGPRRPSALVVPTTVGLTVLVLFFWASGTPRDGPRLPLIAMIVVSGYGHLRRSRPHGS
jgi:hypothetical protein